MIEDGSDEFNEPDDNDDTQDTIYAGTASENAIMLAFRQGLADQMWADRQTMFSRRLDGSGRLGTVQDVQDD